MWPTSPTLFSRSLPSVAWLLYGNFWRQPSEHFANSVDLHHTAASIWASRGSTRMVGLCVRTLGKRKAINSNETRLSFYVIVRAQRYSRKPCMRVCCHVTDIRLSHIRGGNRIESSMHVFLICDIYYVFDPSFDRRIVILMPSTDSETCASCGKT